MKVRITNFYRIADDAVEGRCHVVRLILVQMPDIFTRRLLPTQLLGISRPEFAAPSPYRFIRHDDATLQQHFLHQPPAQRETEIQPNRMRDDPRWKAVVPVTDCR